MIRDACFDDINEIYRFCIKALKHAVYGSVPFDEAKIRKHICRHVSSKHLFCKVSVIDGNIVGILAATIDEMFFSRMKQATDLIFYVERGAEGNKLLTAFTRWAESRHVSIAGISVMFGGPTIERTGKLIESAGYKKAGGVYLRIYDEQGVKKQNV